MHRVKPKPRGWGSESSGVPEWRGGGWRGQVDEGQEKGLGQACQGLSGGLSCSAAKGTAGRDAFISPSDSDGTESEMNGGGN